MSVDRDQILLSAVADEMGDIRADFDSLSGLITELMVWCPPEARADALPQVQSFDLLLQRLEGLSGLVAALGAGVPIDVALHVLTLSDQAARLTGGFGPGPSAVSGDVMLFD